MAQFLSDDVDHTITVPGLNCSYAPLPVETYLPSGDHARPFTHLKVSRYTLACIAFPSVKDVLHPGEPICARIASPLVLDQARHQFFIAARFLDKTLVELLFLAMALMGKHLGHIIEDARSR